MRRHLVARFFNYGRWSLPPCKYMGAFVAPSGVALGAAAANVLAAVESSMTPAIRPHCGEAAASVLCAYPLFPPPFALLSPSHPTNSLGNGWRHCDRCDKKTTRGLVLVRPSQAENEHWGKPPAQFRTVESGLLRLRPAVYSSDNI